MAAAAAGRSPPGETPWPGARRRGRVPTHAASVPNRAVVTYVALGVDGL